jgi:hemerythrin-like domain-containing protein
MDPIGKLMDEHRVIEAALSALSTFAGSLGDADPARREELRGFVTFIREYADAYHHGKEEDMLFTAMVEAGVPSRGGPIAVMLAEHEQGRAYVAVLGRVADGDGPLQEDEVAEVRSAAAGYVELLRAHIVKEDQILYPMAQNAVPAARMEAMAAEFDEYEARESAAADKLAAPFRS